MKFTIDPEILAAKFDAAAQGDAPAFAAQQAQIPRVREVLLMLQWCSFQDGGLAGLVKSHILATFHDAFQTKTMLARAEKKTYADYERDAILAEIPEETLGGEQDEQSNWLQDRLWLKIYCGARAGFLWEPTIDERGDKYRALLNRAELQKVCQDFAAEFLASDLFRVCMTPEAALKPLWYFPNILEILIQVLDTIAAQSKKSIASTAISRDIADALQFALEKKATVRVDGNSRFGKTDSLRAFCHGRPGLARMVTTHCMNSDTDFFLSIADALGLPCNYKAHARVLRMKIEYILRHTGLMLVMDEAHFILPGSAHRAFRPTRINWIRTCLMDRHYPLALVTTPQVFNSEMDRVKRATGINLDQWEGRFARHIALAESLTVEDLLAVVRHKVPDFSDAFQKIIAGAATATINYFSAVQSIVDTARWIASREGRERPTLAELERAIAEAVPNAAAKNRRAIAPALPAPTRSVKPALAETQVAPRRARMPAPRHSTALAPSGDMEMPARETTPALSTV